MVQSLFQAYIIATNMTEILEMTTIDKSNTAKIINVHTNVDTINGGWKKVLSQI